MSDPNGFPAPTEGFVVTLFIVVDNVARSRSFYVDVLGGEAIWEGNEEGWPACVKLANTWIVIDTGGGPTEDKPGVYLDTPDDPDRVSAFMSLRVADIDAAYRDWSNKGAEFLTPPQDRTHAIRCYMRDPDGHLIEIGQNVEQAS